MREMVWLKESDLSNEIPMKNDFIDKISAQQATKKEKQFQSNMQSTSIL